MPQRYFVASLFLLSSLLHFNDPLDSISVADTAAVAPRKSSPTEKTPVMSPMSSGRKEESSSSAVTDDDRVARSASLYLLAT